MRRRVGVGAATVLTLTIGFGACSESARPVTVRLPVVVQANYPSDQARQAQRWTIARADGESRSGTVIEGVAFDLRADSGDWWLWVEMPEHYSGVVSDSDGLQQPGNGCHAAECIHLLVQDDGTIRLPNAGNRVTSTADFTLWDIHENPPDTAHLPADVSAPATSPVATN